jgi:hypothetical protein
VFSQPAILRFLIADIVDGQHASLMIHFGEFRLNPISWLEYVAVSQGCGDWQLHFLPIKSLNDKRIAVHAQDLALDGLNALPFFLTTLQEIRETTFSTGTRVKAKCLRCIGQTQAQHNTA